MPLLFPLPPVETVMAELTSRKLLSDTVSEEVDVMIAGRESLIKR